jgi:CHAD domain
LKSGPAIPLDSRRVATMHDALALLLTDAAAASLNSDRAVHKTRRTLKCARAALRLLRTALGESGYRSANDPLRDASRTLAAVRDSAALLSTLQQLAKPDDGRDLALYTDRVRGHLEAFHRLNRRRLRGGNGGQNHLPCAEVLGSLGQRLCGLPALESESRSADFGLQRVYKRGRTAFVDACDQPRMSLLHEWRKQAKYLASGISLAQLLFQIKLEKFQSRASKLAAVLGEDRDLALLFRRLRELHRAGLLTGGASLRRRLARRIENRRGQLQKKARRLGKRLYRDPPGAFSATLRKALGKYASTH